MTAVVAESEHLRECQDLFELYVSDYIMLVRCKVRHPPCVWRCLVAESYDCQHGNSCC